MMRVAVLAGAFVMAGLAGCASAPSPQAARAEAAPGVIEPVHAAAIVQNQAVFWVTSNGCTDKNDLTPVVAPMRDGSVIQVRRIHEDRCQRPQPQGVEVRWTFEELGLPAGAKVSVETPYQLPPA